MKMNRRNVLIGIGTAAVGSGAALGSGAFTQVEATRTMSVNTAGDSGAYLQLSADATSFVSTPSDGNNGAGVLEIDLSELNDDAKTTIDTAFTVTNGLDEGVGFRIRSDGYSSGEPTGLTIESGTDGDSLANYPTGSDDDNNLDASGGSDDNESVTIIINTNDLNVDDVSEITIEASTDEYQ